MIGAEGQYEQCELCLLICRAEFRCQCCTPFVSCRYLKSCYLKQPNRFDCIMFAFSCLRRVMLTKAAECLAVNWKDIRCKDSGGNSNSINLKHLASLAPYSTPCLRDSLLYSAQPAHKVLPSFAVWLPTCQSHSRYAAPRAAPRATLHSNSPLLASRS